MKKVILIDDDKIFNFINELLIKKTGMIDSVICFEKADEALTHLQTLKNNFYEEYPDIIFLDINMPGMDGWEFLEEYEKKMINGANCDVFILSSSVSPNDIAKSRTYSVVKDFISKPLSEEIVRKILKKQNA